MRFALIDAEKAEFPVDNTTGVHLTRPLTCPKITNQPLWVKSMCHWRRHDFSKCGPNTLKTEFPVEVVDVYSC